MSTIKLKHSSGNSMSIAAPATDPGGALELKLPATVGTAGQVLRNSSTPGTLEFGGLGGGITEVDQWRLTANVTSDAVITSGLSRVNLSGSASPLGTGMSESSGIFTFPHPGKWFIIVKAKFSINNSDSCGLNTQVTVDNSNYTTVTSAFDGNNDAGGGSRDGGASSFYFLDVTDVGQVKVRFTAASLDSGSVLLSSSSEITTGFNFIRLGDT